jgi:putative hemolysin
MFFVAAPFVALFSLVLIVLLSSLYIALGVVSRSAVEEIAASRGSPGLSRRVDRILADLGAHARGVALLNIVATLVFVMAVVEWKARLGGEVTGRHTVTDVVVAIAASAGLLWMAGVLVPMSVANLAGARLICFHARLLRVLAVLTSPFRTLAAFIHEAVRRLAGVPFKDAEEKVQDELLSVVEEGEREGALGGQERDMIEAVMRFGSLTVAQIMTPRTEVEALEYTNNLGEVTKTIKKIGHSRIPVYEESLDHVTGIFYVKDLMRWLAGDGAHGGGRPFELRSILRAAVFVPESKTVRELLTEMIQKKVHIAMVADEYGGTAGLVTIEDIVEEIIGDIKDEYEVGPAETPDVVLRVDQGKAELQAAARIIDANDALSQLGVEIPESEEYDTVGGFVITTLGRIPSKGERFQHERMEFTILEAKPTRVVKVALAVKPADSLGSGGPGAPEEAAGRA